MDSLRTLRCATAGSVDDGKSSLIGRLLLDAKALMTDQIAHVDEASRRRGLTRTDLALITDGLRAEREQGITIDVAWRYFATPRRRFMLADSPGHVQYTRNAVTACSTADVAIVLVDVRRGMTDQTRRHLFVARLVGARSIVVAVNKMDAVSYSLEAFTRVREEIATYLGALPNELCTSEAAFIPMSALLGENVVELTRSMPWYDGPPLLRHLETLPNDAARERPTRFAVQWVIRPQSAGFPDYRGYAGRLLSGSVATGDWVDILPSGRSTRVDRLETARGQTASIVAGESAVVHLEGDLDVGRGDMLAVRGQAAPRVTQEIDAIVTWMHERPARVGATYWLRHTTREVKATLDRIDARYNVATGKAEAFDGELGANDLARVRLRASAPICIDPYREGRATGAIVLVDTATSETVAGAMCL
jgi:sulfate adenylyltransferase large subunit